MPDASLRALLVPVLAAAAAHGRPTLASMVLRVHPPDPLALFRAAWASGDRSSLWLQAGEGFALAALGSAWATSAGGTGRFPAVEGAWTQLCSQAVSALPPRTPERGCGPLLLGGFGFSDDPPTDPLWRGFEAASFTLPELLVSTTPRGSWLTVCRVVEPGQDVEASAAELDSRWQALTSAAATTAPGREAGQLRIVARRPEPSAWRDSVARLAGAVGRGRLDKVVLARAVDLLADERIDVVAVLDRLRGSAPESTTFAFRRDGRVFLGATPERLVRLEGTAFRSVAMAGSAPRTGEAARDAELAADLLRSDKEREEHDVVVTMLREALDPIAVDLDVTPTPRVEAYRHVQHLVTSVEGHLRSPSSLLALAARLHPTPAVGGAPRDLALELVGEEEPMERGWYAGPVGWVDARGNGELVVALRSGVVDGPRATLFAGCGIMADSDPDREWEESENKLRALWGALGGSAP
jgi:isochorismate synthase